MRLWLASLLCLLVEQSTASKGCKRTNRQKWGQYDIDTDYYSVTPDTGRTVHVISLSSSLTQYELTVDHAIMAPDGFERQMTVFNNQFPGPLIEANWGDWIEVHVTNNLKDNGYAAEYSSNT